MGSRSRIKCPPPPPPPQATPGRHITDDVARMPEQMEYGFETPAHIRRYPPEAGTIEYRRGLPRQKAPWKANQGPHRRGLCFVIASLTCPARQSILILSRTVKHLRTVHVQLFPCQEKQ